MSECANESDYITFSIILLLRSACYKIFWSFCFAKYIRIPIWTVSLFSHLIKHRVTCCSTKYQHGKCHFLEDVTLLMRLSHKIAINVYFRTLIAAKNPAEVYALQLRLWSLHTKLCSVTYLWTAQLFILPLISPLSTTFFI